MSVCHLLGYIIGKIGVKKNIFCAHSPRAWTLLLSLLACLAAFLFTPRQAHATPIISQALAEAFDHELEVEDDAIRRVSSSENGPNWQVIHPALWQLDDDHKRTIPNPITSPLLYRERLYYGVGNWLIELNPETGVIERRERFPSNLIEVNYADANAGDDAQDAGLIITLRVADALENGSYRVDFHHHPGRRITPEIWYPGVVFYQFGDAANLLPGINLGEYTPDPDKLKENLNTLDAQSAQEPTHPFYTFYRGMLLGLNGQQEEAHQAFEKTANMPDLDWMALLILSSFFDREGEYALADLSFARAKESIKADNLIDIQQWSSFSAMSRLFGWSRPTMAAAIESGDFEAIDRMMERIAWTFPNLPYTTHTYQYLADSMAKNGQDALAEKWRARAEEPAPTPLAQLDEHLYQRIDLATLLFVALFFATLLGAFCFGLRHRRRPGETLIVRKMPRHELFSLLSTALLLFVALNLTWSSILVAVDLNYTPNEPLTGSWSSPNTRKWVENLRPGDARDELLQQIEDYAEASKNGALENYAGPLPEAKLLSDAVYADTRHRLRLGLLFGPSSDDGPLEALVSNTIMLIAFLLPLLFILLLGRFLADKAPRLTSILRILIPGAARSAGPFTPFIAGATLAATAALLLHLGNFFHPMSIEQYASYYNLHPLGPPTHHAPLRPLYYFILAITLTTHIATTLHDRNHKPPTPTHTPEPPGSAVFPGEILGAQDTSIDTAS